jgi:hypothetical protein
VRECSSGRDHDIGGDRGRDDRAAEYPALAVKVVDPVEDEFRGGETPRLAATPTTMAVTWLRISVPRPNPKMAQMTNASRFSSTDPTTIQPVSAGCEDLRGRITDSAITTTEEISAR